MTAAGLESVVSEALRAFKTDEVYAVSVASMAVAIVRKRAAWRVQAARRQRQSEEGLCVDQG